MTFLVPDRSSQASPTVKFQDSVPKEKDVWSRKILAKGGQLTENEKWYYCSNTLSCWATPTYEVSGFYPILLDKGDFAEGT